MRVEPQKAHNIILARIVLHNIATRRNVPHYDDGYAPEPVGNQDQDQMLAFPQNERLNGRSVRDEIVKNYF